LSHPNIASKHWIIRQYDHEVQAGSVIKPLTGPHQRGPSDAAVIRPKLDSFKGVAIACGLAPHIRDPYAMAIAAIDEAIRNAVAVGADLRQLAMLDNFCWPSVDDERTLGTLVRTCEACYDAAKAYGVPFISGKDSLHNQFTDTETGKVTRIPNTLLISTIGVIDDVRRCVTMDLKEPGNSLWLLRSKTSELPYLANVHRTLSKAIAAGLVRACHDVSDGGALTAVAEMCIAAGMGASLFNQQPDDDWLFSEPLATYVVELPRDRFAAAYAALDQPGVVMKALGEVTVGRELTVSNISNSVTKWTVESLTHAFTSTLDW
jgi:phosphoribosylformylglycinamidine synthase